MNYWEEIGESPVIKKFMEFCYKCWRVDIHFYDEYSNCMSNNNIPLQNNLCQLVHSNGAKHCFRNYKNHLTGFNKSKNKKPDLYRCHAGLQVIAIPLFVKGKHIGAMIGSGYRLSKIGCQRQTMYINKLTRLGYDKTELERCYNKQNMIDNQNEQHLIDFMELVAEDVISFYKRLQEEEETIKKQIFLQERTYSQKYKGIIGASQSIKKVFDTLGLIEKSESPVLIEGESGTGKELIAFALHYNSLRRNKMFIIQNCSIFTNTLSSSELIGHVKGAFTGAVSDKKGIFEIADEGTLFLDEIGDMNIEIQAKLLRVIEDGSFYKVGSTEQKKVDVRIISATNKNLIELVEQGLFRKDLFYRLNSMHITVPPLRERKDDIISLTNYFLESFAKVHGEEKKKIDKKVIEQLVSYRWPGNIRELKNLVEWLIISSGKNKTIVLDYLPVEFRVDSYPKPFIKDNNNGTKIREIFRLFENKIIEDELRKAEGNKTVASKNLGISRATLNNKLEIIYAQKRV